MVAEGRGKNSTEIQTPVVTKGTGKNDTEIQTPVVTKEMVKSNTEIQAPVTKGTVQITQKYRHLWLPREQFKSTQKSQHL